MTEWGRNTFRKVFLNLIGSQARHDDRVTGLMARSSVDVAGLPREVWWYAAKICLVLSRRTMPFAWSKGTGCGGTGWIGMVHNPLSFRLPVMITWWFFIILTPYLVNSAMHSLSQSWLKEMRVPVLGSSSKKSCWDRGVRAGYNCTWPQALLGMILPFAAIIMGPSLDLKTLFNKDRLWLVKNEPVAPESSIASFLCGWGGNTLLPVRG